MHCVFPSCKHDVRRPYLNEITFYRFPEEETLRVAWLEALGKEDWELEANSVVCSKHFLTEDFLVTRRGRKLRSDAVPVDHVEVCRICFAKDCELYSIKDNTQLDLSRPSYAFAYETLTGFSVQQEDRLPPYLCIQCANQLMICVRFMAKCIRAHSILKEIVNDYGYVSLESILSIDTIHNPHSSDILINHNDSKNNIENESTYNGEQDLKLENVTFDSFNVEDNGLFNQNILITDVRSAYDKECLSNLQDDSGDCSVKMENYNSTINETNYDIVNIDEAAHVPSPQKSNMGNHVRSKKHIIHKRDSFTKESSKYDLGNGIIGEDCAVNGSYCTEKAKQKDVVCSKKQKPAILPTKNLRRKVNTNWTRISSGGLLLSYKMLSCDICRFKTVSKVQLVHHLKTHSATKLYNCNKCYFLTNSKTRLQFHKETHCKMKSYSCDICYKTFSYNNDLKIHLRVHSGVKPFTCNICKKKFSQHNQLTAHLRIHSGEKPFSCNVCSKSFRQKGQLQTHFRLHSGEKPYTCDVCQKAFIQRGQLQNHLLIHSTDKPYSCDICGKSFSIKGRLQNHMRTHADKF